MKSTPIKQPLFINCHTHIFTGQHIPPYIGKKFMTWPFYKWFSISFVLQVCRFWYLSPKSPAQLKYKCWYKKLQRGFYNYRSFIQRHGFLKAVVSLVNFILTYHALFYFLRWIISFFIKIDGNTKNLIVKCTQWLADHHLLLLSLPSFIKILVFLFTIVFIAKGRKIIFFVWRKLWSFLSILPNKKTIEFVSRYINIGRFAYYKSQSRIFLKLKDQYPADTGFVILPMDMEFMDAGPVSEAGSYENQMKELAAIKRNKKYGDLVYPFIAVDPRRKSVGQKIFFDWQPQPDGAVALSDCFIRDYIAEGKHAFSGFKIYPALGYYPFDEALLPLWKYAADNQLPIITHCIRGTIFYRGTKKKEWGEHPIFKQADGKGNYSPLLLPELKNVDFINNFTHPLNYLCLVEEKLLRLLVGRAADNKIRILFGYSDDATPLLHDLKHLKLCFGHFGGEDEWQKFFEKDRDGFTNKLVTEPGRGISFIKAGDISSSYGALEQVWKNVDWYSIIRSMMLQYPNLYADISYIVHDEKIVPLLKQTLSNPVLKERVLFGTDFYVVRNHKSEKEMLANLQAALTSEELDYITGRNGKTFINLPLS